MFICRIRSAIETMEHRMSIEGMPSMKGTPQQQLMASQRSIHENDGHYGPPGGWQDEADTGMTGPATHNVSFPMHPDSAQWNSSDRMNSRNMAASGGPVGVPGPPGGEEDTAELVVSRKRKHGELADREERGSRAASAGSKVRRAKVTIINLVYKWPDHLAPVLKPMLEY